MTNFGWGSALSRWAIMGAAYNLRIANEKKLQNKAEEAMKLRAKDALESQELIESLLHSSEEPFIDKRYNDSRSQSLDVLPTFKQSTSMDVIMNLSYLRKEVIAFHGSYQPQIDAYNRMIALKKEGSK